MKFAYFDCSAGISGDMILAALLDLGVPPAAFKKQMACLKLPVKIEIGETMRGSLRALKVDVRVKKTAQDSDSHRARTWSDIETIIGRSPFNGPVKVNALAIFQNLFEVESKVHGQPFHQVHLHEAAADDALIDVIGSCFLADELGIGVFYASPLNVGSGWVKTSHGVLPVPPPAVTELLKNVPVYSAHVQEELVTPTGAAIVSTWAKSFSPLPQLCYEKIGCGAGAREFHHFPNILRVFYGEEKDSAEPKTIYQIEANIDDSSPQVLATFIDAALRTGALDVWLTPIVMKKNRLATKLTLLTELDKMEGLIKSVFRETSSIGVRYFPVARRVLLRRTEKVRVLDSEIRIKITSLEGEDTHVQPEFFDCHAVAEKTKRPVKDIIRRALNEYDRKAR